VGSAGWAIISTCMYNGLEIKLGIYTHQFTPAAWLPSTLEHIAAV